MHKILIHNSPKDSDSERRRRFDIILIISRRIILFWWVLCFIVADVENGKSKSNKR